MGNRVIEEQISFIKKTKSIICSPLTPAKQEESPRPIDSPLEKSFQESPPEVVTDSTLEEIIQRIEKIEQMLVGEQDQQDGMRKSKIKEQIISLLREKGRLSSHQLSKQIDLSRTRCNEYFRELTREGLTEGVVINRQKYYKLVKK